MAYIKIKNINLTIKKDIILSNVNAEFDCGKIYGIIGRNGSGKTMLMKCLTGFVKPTSGEIIVNNKTMGKNNDFLDDAGIIIETPSFIPYYSGYKNLKLLADINKKITKEDVTNIIKKVGLDPKMKRSVKKYSLGMRQRLGIAQAIMENPTLLILDEPMNGLDKEAVSEIRNILLELKKEGKLIIITSHFAEDIDILCDEVYEMDKGIMTHKKTNKSKFK